MVLFNIIMLAAVSYLTLELFMYLRSVWCYYQAKIIDEWVYCYKALTEQEDIGYDICSYATDGHEATMELVLDLRKWSKRSLCNDKEKFDKLKKFVYANNKECYFLIKELRNDPEYNDIDKFDEN